MKNLTISSLNEAYPDFEIVERKGIGHPDTLCDAIAEQASCEYSKYCIKKFSKVPHHWFDKVMLIGGESSIDYGKGEITFPYTVIFVGKAALKVGEENIPLEDILYKAAATVLSNTLYQFIPEKHLKTEIRVCDYKGPGQKSKRYRPASKDELIDIDSKAKVSNDCNICVGYAPLSLLETIVLNLEKELSVGHFKTLFPDTGYDIKIIGTRTGESITLQINLPFIAQFISDFSEYINRVSSAEDFIKQYVKINYGIIANIIVNPEKNGYRPYLTVTGSVADTGDVGVVGRGNRINGLITPLRPMSIEASAGKNPLDHTGKLYGIVAIQLAKSIFEQTNLKNIVVLSTTKEKPLNEPDFLFISIENWKNNKSKYGQVIKDIINQNLNNIYDLPHKIIEDGIVQW